MRKCPLVALMAQAHQRPFLSHPDASWVRRTLRESNSRRLVIALPGLPPSAKPQTIQRYNTSQGLPLRPKLLNAFYGPEKSHPFRQKCQ
jgi:hypothetical protein